MKLFTRKRVIIISSIITILIIGSSVMAYVIYAQLFNRVDEPLERQYYTYLRWSDIDQAKYPREEVWFHSGKNRLQGFIYGDTNDLGLVVVSHGLGGTADGYLSLIMYFVDKGWRVFAFNNTGVSGSEGKDMRGLPQSAIDLDAALTYIENSDRLGNLPLMLIGHSWGGHAVCAVLNWDHRVNAAVSFVGFNNGYEIFKEQGGISAGAFFKLLSPHFWAIHRVKFGSVMKFTAVDGINKANIPVMIVHSSDDRLVSDKSTAIYAYRDKITNPYVELVYFDGEEAAGHEFVFYSETIRLANQSMRKYRAETPNPSFAQWVEEYQFDKIAANELNGELMERINTFFELTINNQ